MVLLCAAREEADYGSRFAQEFWTAHDCLAARVVLCPAAWWMQGAINGRSEHKGSRDSAFFGSNSSLLGATMKFHKSCCPRAVGMLVLLLGPLLSGCGPSETLPSAPLSPQSPTASYVIGPGDELKIFVWRNPELSLTMPVLPDGRFSMPLIDDVPANGKTPTQLSRAIEVELGQFIKDALVTVIVTKPVGPFTQQVRVVGEATNPRAIPYRANMTALDVMIEAGGLTKFAAGNRATLVRLVDGEQKEFRVRLDDLLNDGDMSANVAMRPGDVVVVPETFF